MKQLLITLFVVLVLVVMAALSIQPDLTLSAKAIPNLPPRPAVSAPGRVVDKSPDILLASDRQEATPGDFVTYSATIKNNRTGKAQGVEVRVPPIDGLEVLQVSSTKGKTTFNAGNNTWKVIVGGMQPGAEVQITVQAKVKRSASGDHRVYNVIPLFYKGGYKLSNMVILGVAGD